MVPSDEEARVYRNTWNEYLDEGHRVVKFVPASGAASRMFKNLFSFLSADYDEPTTDFERAFFDNIKLFAFREALCTKCRELYGKRLMQLKSEGRYKDIVRALLLPEGLNYGSLPKGLLLFHEYDDVKDQAKQSAEVSHCHSEGIKGAQCVAALIYWLRTCRITKDEVENSVRRSFGYELPPLKDIMRIGSLGHFDSTCQETVPWAIRCFLESTNYENAIRTAVMADGDTDTKAAICGSIAEAYYDIPEELIEKALRLLPDEMIDVIDRFYDNLKIEIEY